GSCAAPSAKGDDKFITTDYLQQCPVKHALSKVEGVSKTDVSFDKRQAVVTFDDAKTNVQKLTKATEDAGYPSSLKR
ncbi:cation transporter, partial [Klebsiella pneumoniae]|uniref:cation transporter n=1 Tax=Klebsiella pneumoniae TaxID=573 RepID=UPI001E433585